MSRESKKVLTFVGVGIVAACVFGLLVWRLNAPLSHSTAESGFDSAGELAATSGNLDAAARSPEADERDEHSEPPRATGSPEQGARDTSEAAAGGVPAGEPDPFLPPHAISPDRPAQAAAPTRVYRPSNVGVPTEESGGQADGGPHRRPGNVQVSESPESTTVKPSAGQPGQPGTTVVPGESVVPDKPGEPATPSAPTEPTPEQPGPLPLPGTSAENNYDGPGGVQLPDWGEVPGIDLPELPQGLPEPQRP